MLWYCECIRDFLVIWSVCWAYFKIGWCNHWMGVVGYMICYRSEVGVPGVTRGGRLEGRLPLAKRLKRWRLVEARRTDASWGLANIKIEQVSLPGAPITNLLATCK